MSTDDIIYAILLLLGIGFGNFYRKIKDIDTKKWIGTLFGLFIVFFTSGYSSYHLFVIIFAGYFLLIFSGRYNHLIIFWFLMSYLLFFRSMDFLNLPTPSGHLNMIHMVMTLKIIGFAFERNSTVTKARSGDKSNDKKSILTPMEEEIEKISFINLFHYCFNYIGLLTGPYYTYKTFFDYFNLPFAINAENSFKVTLNKLKFLPITVFLFIGASYIWPLEYAISAEFYEQRSWLYRLSYVWPTFFIFRMRIYSGMILSECICTLSGFGAYPRELDPKCGHGPSKEITQEFIDIPENREYDFETVQNVNMLGVEKCFTFREAMKHWNKCVQFWLAVNIYKRFPNKKYRIVATMLVSAYWHGVLPGHYFCILGPVFYLPVEDLYLKLVVDENASNIRKNLTNAMTWILKFFAFSYMGTAFLLKDVKTIWHYYSSVYHFAYVFWALLYVACIFLWKQKKSALKKKEKMLKNEGIKIE